MLRQFSKEDIPHALTQIGRLSDAVKAEFDLIGTRMVWLVTSQSFLFAAFASLAVNLKSETLVLGKAVWYLVYAVPLMGAAFALIVAIALHAARAAVVRLKKQREEMMLGLPGHLRIRLISDQDVEHKLGNLPPLLIPGMLVVVWGGVLLTLPWVAYR